MTLPFKSSYGFDETCCSRYLIFWHMWIIFVGQNDLNSAFWETGEYTLYCWTLYIVMYSFSTWKTKCTTKCWISYIMMYSILTSSGNHYFVIFIVVLSKYVYLLNETRVWNILMCSKNFGMKILFESLLFDQSDGNFSYDFGIRICRNCSNK